WCGLQRGVFWFAVSSRGHSYHREPESRLMARHDFQRRDRLIGEHYSARILRVAGAPWNARSGHPKGGLKAGGKKHREVEPARADFTDNADALADATKSLGDRIENDLVYPRETIEKSRQFAANENRQLRIGISLPDRPQRRQTHYEVAQPVDFLDQDSLRWRVKPHKSTARNDFGKVFQTSEPNQPFYNARPKPAALSS